MNNTNEKVAPTRYDFFVWQGQKGSNPRHSVLETDALPTELYPYIMVDQQFRLKKQSGGLFFTRKSLSQKASEAPLDAHINQLMCNNGTTLTLTVLFLKMVDQQGLEPRTNRL